jgi:hypothetical protein
LLERKREDVAVSWEELMVSRGKEKKGELRGGRRGKGRGGKGREGASSAGEQGDHKFISTVIPGSGNTLSNHH